MRSVETGISIEYTSLETDPLPDEIWRKLNYVQSQQSAFEKIHLAQWDSQTVIAPTFQLLKVYDSIQKNRLQPSYFDLIYFDAFAPNKQPEMWELPVLQKVSDSMKPQGIFVTYCAKGQVKRNLKTTGLTVESLPGPRGKREMTRAHKS